MDDQRVTLQENLSPLCLARPCPLRDHGPNELSRRIEPRDPRGLLLGDVYLAAARDGEAEDVANGSRAALGRPDGVVELQTPGRDSLRLPGRREEQ
ncbi:MAG: hypothetical protein V9E87_02800 [Gemmatimonadales bacterium]